MNRNISNVYVQTLAKVFTKNNQMDVDELFAPYFRAHVPLLPALNYADYKEFLRGLYKSFPDMRYEICDAVLTNEHVVLRLTQRGTHMGDFLEIPPSRSEVTLSSMHIFHLNDGLIVENWTEMDFFGALRQINTVPLTSRLIGSN